MITLDIYFFYVADGMVAGRRRIMESRLPAPPTVQIVVEILELLDANTDREHGMSAMEIGRRLGVTEKTIRGHLKLLAELKPFGREIGRLRREDLAHAQSADPRPGWFIEPVLDTAQMRLLADGAAMSRADGEYLQDLVAKIYACAGQAGQLKAIGMLETPRNYNTEFLSNVERINDAIAHERAIGFHYCTYDMDGRLVPRRNGDGEPRNYHADPYRMVYKNGKYYLVCHLRSYDDIAYLHMERLRHLTVDPEDHSISRTLDSFSPNPGEPFDLAGHMNERPYPMNGPAVPIHLRIRRTLEPLYDWFDDAQVSDAGGNVYDVRIVADERSALWWILQYSETDLIEVLEPQSLRDELGRVGRRMAARYAKENYDDDAR